jgi:hypothetical protein
MPLPDCRHTAERTFDGNQGWHISSPHAVWSRLPGFISIPSTHSGARRFFSNTLRVGQRLTDIHVWRKFLQTWPGYWEQRVRPSQEPSIKIAAWPFEPSPTVATTGSSDTSKIMRPFTSILMWTRVHLACWHTKAKLRRHGECLLSHLIFGYAASNCSTLGYLSDIWP